MSPAAASAARGVLAGIVGNAHVRDADPADAVGGMVPSLVVSPADEAQVADVLAWATRDGLAVVVRGGGTKLDWAPPPRACDVLLSTARLDALVEHEPGDLVCVAQAGMRLAALQDALAPHGQRLSLDPAHGVAATLGGIVAAGAWGPLRTHHGTPRDVLIGARFVLADGAVGHSGGKVVKNVAGYDVGRLLVGSQGTLAVITQVALRLHPRPRAWLATGFDGLDGAALDAAWRAVERSGGEPAAMVALWPDGVLLLRFEGSEAGVAAHVARFGGEAIEPERAEALWATARDAVWGGEPATVAAVGVPRTDLPLLLERLADPPAERAVILPSLGLAEVRLRHDATAEQVVALRRFAESRGGHLSLRRPTAALAAHARPSLDPVAADLMRSLKRALDPAQTLAPGRFAAGI